MVGAGVAGKLHVHNFIQKKRKKDGHCYLAR